MNLEQPLQYLLQKIKSGDNALITESNNQAAKWEQENLTDYLVALCATLMNQNVDVYDRQMAGILLRGTVQAKNEELVEQKRQRWLQGLPDVLKQKIKEAVISLLAAPELHIRQTAAQIISAIALVEISAGRWPELFPLLLQYSTSANTPETLKQAALDTIGFICEMIKPELLEAHADKILTAIVHCMRPDQASIPVKRSACNALLNALDFCRQNFENAEEREVLMNVILDALNVPDETVKVSTLTILVEIASQHYDKLMQYMQAVFKISLEAISSPDVPENIAKQAIEFWCTICEEELNIIEETEYAKEFSLPAPTRVCQYYIKGALPYLVPVITETLTRQEDSGDHDECTVAMAGGICLNLIAQTVEDDVVPFVAPFIERHVGSQDWRFREAAVLAFGSILEGPQTVIKQLIHQATPVLLSLMRDPKTAVKDTTAWTIGRILKLHHKAVIPHVENILKVMGEALGDKPKVASNAAWAIHNLAYSFHTEDINPLNQYFSNVVKLLLVNSERPDADDDHLRVSTYEALNVVLATAPPPAIPSLTELLDVILDRMDKTFNMEILHQDDQNKQNELQGLLCGVIQVITQKIDKRILPYADRIMSQVLRLFKSKKDSGVHEEAFLTVAAVANVVDTDFSRYMNEFFPYLCAGLDNFQEYQVCCIAVGVVGDLARALSTGLTGYCDRMITSLLQNLQNKALDRSVKPPILSCFGDIALAIGGNFIKYLEVVMGMLKQAADTVIKTNLSSTEDYDLVEYMNSLREGIFEAYTGIIQGLRTDKKGDYILPHSSSIVQLVLHVATDKRRSESVSRCAVGICGDLAVTLGPRIKHSLSQPHILQLIDHTIARAESAETKETAEWARQQIIGQ